MFICCWDLICACRIRVKLREAAEGYDFTLNFFLRCLYAGEKGDPQNPDVGFLKGPLLLHLSQLCSPHQVNNCW